MDGQVEKGMDGQGERGKGNEWKKGGVDVFVYIQKTPPPKFLADK